MGLFAGSNWGKMRMFLTDKGYFMTLRQFSPASTVLLQFECRKIQHLQGSLIDNSPISSGIG